MADYTLKRQNAFCIRLEEPAVHPLEVLPEDMVHNVMDSLMADAIVKECSVQPLFDFLEQAMESTNPQTREVRLVVEGFARNAMDIACLSALSYAAIPRAAKYHAVFAMVAIVRWLSALLMGREEVIRVPYVRIPQGVFHLGLAPTFVDLLMFNRSFRRDKRGFVSHSHGKIMQVDAWAVPHRHREEMEAILLQYKGSFFGKVVCY
jgi:hypothetical protein